MPRKRSHSRNCTARTSSRSPRGYTTDPKDTSRTLVIRLKTSANGWGSDPKGPSSPDAGTEIPYHTTSLGIRFEGAELSRRMRGEPITSSTIHSYIEPRGTDAYRALNTGGSGSGILAFTNKTLDDVLSEWRSQASKRESRLRQAVAEGRLRYDPVTKTYY